MAEPRTYGPLDDTQQPLGDAFFERVDERSDPAALPQGVLSKSINMRLDRRTARDRGAFRPIYWGKGDQGIVKSFLTHSDYRIGFTFSNPFNIDTENKIVVFPVSGFMRGFSASANITFGSFRYDSYGNLTELDTVRIGSNNAFGVGFGQTFDSTNGFCFFADNQEDEIYSVPMNSDGVFGPVKTLTISGSNVDLIDMARDEENSLVFINGDPDTGSSFIRSYKYNTSSTNITNLSGSGKWSGAIEALGKIYCIPVGAEEVLIINPDADTADKTTITGLTGSLKWEGGVLAGNGKIYCVPYNSENVLIIDPATDTAEQTSITGLSGSTKWVGAVLAGNGKIYCIPYESENVLIIDPATDTAEQSSITGLTGSAKWAGGALASNGKIYCAPYNSENVLIIDPDTDTAEESSITGIGAGSSKWWGATLSEANGKIYCVPHNDTTVLIIDPSDDTAEKTSITGLTGVTKWVGGTLATSNGKIYCIPYTAEEVLIIDPSDDTADRTTIDGLSGIFKWRGGVLSSNGKIYTAPYTSEEVLIIDPATDTVTRPDDFGDQVDEFDGSTGGVAVGNIDGTDYLFALNDSGDIEAYTYDSDGNMTATGDTITPQTKVNARYFHYDDSIERLVTWGEDLDLELFSYDGSSFTSEEYRDFTGTMADTAEPVFGGEGYSIFADSEGAGGTYFVSFKNDRINRINMRNSDLYNTGMRGIAIDKERSLCFFFDAYEGSNIRGKLRVAHYNTGNRTQTSIAAPVKADTFYNPVKLRQTSLILGGDTLFEIGDDLFSKAAIPDIGIKSPLASDFTQAFDQVFVFRGFDLKPLRWDIADNNKLVVDENVPNGKRGIYLSSRLWVVNSRDTIAASDILDPTTFDLASNEFSIAKGGFDEIEGLAAITDNRIVILKSRSIWMLNNVRGSFRDLNLDQVNSVLGCIAGETVINVGNNILFLSERGIYSVRQVLETRLTADPTPLSYDLQPLFDRMNFRAASGATSEFFGDRYYCAIPTGDSETNNTVVILRNERGNWFCEGYDNFANSDFHPVSFFRTREGKEEKLFAVSASGYIYEYETDAEGQDRINDTYYEVDKIRLTRGYSMEMRNQRTFYGWARIATFDPKYDIDFIQPDTSSETVALTDQTKSRTNYYTAYTSDWVATNEDDDFQTEGREDYSVVPGASGIQPGSTGLPAGLRQEIQQPFYVQRRGRYTQVKITNKQGFMELVGCMVSSNNQKQNLIVQP